MVLGDMKAAFAPPQRLPRAPVPLPGTLACAAPRQSRCGCGLSCLVALNSNLYRLCGSLHGLDTFLST